MTSSEGKLYCTECKRLGHEARNCYWKKSQENSGESVSKTTMCFFCHVMGHTIATCIKRKEVDQGKVKAGAGLFSDNRCFRCGVIGHIAIHCGKGRKEKEESGTKYIPNHSSIAVPLTDLSKKGRSNTVAWNDASEIAYLALKTLLVSKVVLQLCDLLNHTYSILMPLVYRNQSKYTSGRIMWWALYLLLFRIQIKAIKGSQNAEADYLSRVN